MAASGLHFLNGGGEMGERMRRLDWSTTPLGDPQHWPQSLKTIVRVMLDSRFAMWMAWGPAGTFFCNDAYLPTVGIKRDWVLGARADRVWEEIWHDIGPRIRHVLNTGQATWDEGLQLFLRRSGYDEETFHTFSYSPVYDDRDAVAGMLCVVVEDTERVIGTRRLQLLRALASTSTGHAVSVAQAGQFLLHALRGGLFDLPFAALYLADAGGGARLVGSSVEVREGGLPGAIQFDADAPLAQAMGSGCEEVIGDLTRVLQVRTPWLEPVQEALCFPLTSAAEPRPFGWLLLGVSTRRERDERYQSFLTLVADQFASQMADTQSRLDARRRAEALAELDRAKSLFFSNVSHEFRTPLTLMLGPIDDLLGSAELPARARADLDLVQRNGRRLRKLVNSLLDFSRIEGGGLEPLYRPTDLAAFTTELAGVFRAAIEVAGLTLTVRCDTALQSVYVDRDMWEKVVLNLLSNALKFTFEGGIEVSLAQRDGSAELQVRDSGVGIDDASLARIFERFHRVSGARSRSQEGTGIGLALVKELVKVHGGSVDATSAPGRGTVFTVRVPLGNAHLPAQRVATDAATAAHPTVDRNSFVEDAQRAGDAGPRIESDPGIVPPSPGGAGRHERILVVDDNADMRAYVQRLLAPRWQVETAGDGRQALVMIGARAPDLILTDMMMPDMDGRALIQHIRTDAQLRALPVIVLSAQAGEEARVAGLNQGADDYLVKPFSAAELLARVEVQLMRAKVRRTEDLLNKRLADVFRNAPVGVALLRGADHVYEFANDVYQDFVRHRRIIGLTIATALPEVQSQGIIELLDGVRASGQAYRGHAYPVQLEGEQPGALEQRYFEFIFQPLVEDADHAAGIAVVALDVTELMAARTAAEAASRAKDEFIAILGHELRNPLAPIVTALHLMKMRSGDVAVAEREIIERQVKHMRRLVDDMLDVSRITRGNLELDLAVHELATIVERAVETAAPLFEKKRQLVDVDVPRRGLAVRADAIRLTQVIANVLTNAAKFTDDGGSIRVQARRDDTQVLLTVNDSGCGMTRTELDSVFGLFVQGSQEINRPRGGLGLGLTIARNLARLHGGSLHADSDGPGNGSRFTLRLPLDAAAAATEPGALPLPAGRAALGTKRILVVDDTVDVALTLQQLLRECGYEVVVAHDAPGALRLVAGDGRFDVGLLDLGLPVMSGFELAQQLRASPAGARMRLVALSGYGQASDIERTRQSGFDAHLIKPVDVDALLAAIDPR